MHAPASVGAVGQQAHLPGPLRNPLVKLRAGHGFIHEAPINRAPAFHAFLYGAEHISQVPAYHPFIDHPRETAGAGQNGKQGNFRQRYCGIAVVDQDQVIHSQRQFITAAGRRPVHRAQVALAREFPGVFNGVAGLIGEFTEVHLMAVGGVRQHADVGAGAEHGGLSGTDHHSFYFRVLKTQALNGIVQFDIDPYIVGVEFQFVAGERTFVLVHVHVQPGDCAGGRQLPVAVTVGMRLEIQLQGIR